MPIQVDYTPNLSDYGAAIAQATQQSDAYDKMMEYQQLLRQVQAQQAQQNQAAQGEANRMSLARAQMDQREQLAQMNAPPPDYTNKTYLPGGAGYTPPRQPKKSAAPPQGFLDQRSADADSALAASGTQNTGITITRSKKKFSSPGQALLDKVHSARAQKALDMDAKARMSIPERQSHMLDLYLNPSSSNKR